MIAGYRSAAGPLVAMLGWLAAAASGAAGWSDVYVRLGHSNTVLVVAFSPDGRTLASGAGDNISQDDLKRLIASIPATKKVCYSTPARRERWAMHWR